MCVWFLSESQKTSERTRNPKTKTTKGRVPKNKKHIGKTVKPNKSKCERECLGGGYDRLSWAAFVFCFLFSSEFFPNCVSLKGSSDGKKGFRSSPGGAAAAVPLRAPTGALTFELQRLHVPKKPRISAT